MIMKKEDLDLMWRITDSNIRRTDIVAVIKKKYKHLIPYLKKEILDRQYRLYILTKTLKWRVKRRNGTGKLYME